MVRFPVLRALLALLCISLAAGQLRAAPVELRSDASGQSLNGQIELLEDVGGTLSIADMAAPAIQ